MCDVQLPPFPLSNSQTTLVLVDSFAQLYLYLMSLDFHKGCCDPATKQKLDILPDCLQLAYKSKGSVLQTLNYLVLFLLNS